MMRKLFSRKYDLLFSIFLLVTYIHPNIAKCQYLSVDQIPDDLINDEINMVIRNENFTFKVMSIGEGFETYNNAITLLNPKAKSHRVLRVRYDDLSKITKLSAKLYDAEGKLIEQFKEKDFQDISAYDGSMYSDNRIKYLSIAYNKYPFTIELTYQKVLDGLMFYPNYAFNSTNGPVEESTLMIELPQDLSFNYKLINAKEPLIQEHNGIKTFKWQYKNLKKFKVEAYSPPLAEQLIRVETSPDRFQFGGFIGQMNSWESLGKFQNTLNNSLEPLPIDVKTQAEKLVLEHDTDAEKIEKVYKYLQNNFRYVSVQLGVGGWRPFSPKFVHENGFGDCKALSFYTKAMLESLGIKSYYTLISAGDSHSTLDPDFPTRQFNHVILCTPINGDTIWLECTSQTNPLGYCGKFTGDRKVLVVTENGGKIAKTPSYPWQVNERVNNAFVEINEKGEAHVNSIIFHRGLQYEYKNLNFAIHYGYDDQRRWLYRTLGIPDFEITNHSLENKPSKIPEATINVCLKTSDFVSMSGDLLVLSPNIMNRLTSIPPKTDTRKSPIIIEEEFIHYDSINFELPSNTQINYIPENKNIKTSFGSYEIQFREKDHSLVYIRKFSLRRARLSPNQYENFRTFFKEIQTLDESKVLLKRE